MRFISWHEIGSVLQLLQVVEGIEGIETSSRIFYDFICKIDIENLAKSYNNARSVDTYFVKLLIDSCYYIEQISHSDYYTNCFKNMFINCRCLVSTRSDIIWALLPEYQQSFYHLICLCCDGIIRPKKFNYSFEVVLLEVVRRYGEHLSTTTLNKILEYGRLIHSERICNSVRELLEGEVLIF